MRIAVFAGSFDPFTKGHEEIVLRALPLFDKVIIAFGINSAKKYFYDLPLRMQMVEKLFEAQKDKIEVASYNGLTMHFAQEKGAQFLLRGLRNTTDYDYEYGIACGNKIAGKGLETIFLMASPQYAHISSTIVRELLKASEDVSAFLPKAIIELGQNSL